MNAEKHCPCPQETSSLSEVFLDFNQIIMLYLFVIVANISSNPIVCVLTRNLAASGQVICNISFSSCSSTSFEFSKQLEVPSSMCISV